MPNERVARENSSDRRKCGFLQIPETVECTQIEVPSYKPSFFVLPTVQTERERSGAGRWGGWGGGGGGGEGDVEEKCLCLRGGKEWPRVSKEWRGFFFQRKSQFFLFFKFCCCFEPRVFSLINFHLRSYQIMSTAYTHTHARTHARTHAPPHHHPTTHHHHHPPHTLHSRAPANRYRRWLGEADSEVVGECGECGELTHIYHLSRVAWYLRICHC